MTLQEYSGGHQRGHRQSYIQSENPFYSHSTHHGHKTYQKQYEHINKPEYQNQNGHGRRGGNKDHGEHNQHHNNGNTSTQVQSPGFEIKDHRHRNQQQPHGGSWYTGPSSVTFNDGNGSGRSNSKPYDNSNRIVATQQDRVKKVQSPSPSTAFSRSSNNTNTSTSTSKLPAKMRDCNPFSKGLQTLTRDDTAIAKERERVRRFILRNYKTIKEDNPNLGYLVELCVNSPSKDLHRVIRTRAFSNLMQFQDMDKIYGELFHFYVGISQCRGGHGLMDDDVVMCDCDGRVPQCFTVAFMGILREYLETKKSLDDIYQAMDAFDANTLPDILKRPVKSGFPVVSTALESVL